MNRDRLVEYYPKEETLPPMIEEYVPLDKHHDNFFERFMEQRIQRLNQPDLPNTVDPLPFPIEALRSIPSVTPRKRVSNTSSDSGVNSPHMFSTGMPTTPFNHHLFVQHHESTQFLHPVYL